jgi:aminoglycoside phosphotransferase (APT) family kinase protein
LEKAGGAMMVMEQVAGNAFGSPISSIIQDDGLCRGMAAHLARLHGVPPSATEFGCSTVDTRSKILSMIESSAVDLGKTGVDSPVHTYAFQWLRDNLHLVGPREAVVHGDYGPHNLLVEDGRVNAILDWEFVKIGHPAEDICWPRLSIEAVGSWEIFLDAYVKAGGIRPTDDELRYFSILGLARISVMQTQIDSAFGEGPATLVRWAAPGVERFRPSMLRLGQMLGLEAA